MRGEAAARSRCARRVSASELPKSVEIYATAALLNRGRGRSAGQVEVMERRGRVRCPRPAAKRARQVPVWTIVPNAAQRRRRRFATYAEVLDATRYSPSREAHTEAGYT